MWIFAQAGSLIEDKINHLGCLDLKSRKRVGEVKFLSPGKELGKPNSCQPQRASARIPDGGNSVLSLSHLHYLVFVPKPVSCDVCFFKMSQTIKELCQDRFSKGNSKAMFFPCIYIYIRCTNSALIFSSLRQPGP